MELRRNKLVILLSLVVGVVVLHLSHVARAQEPMDKDVFGYTYVTVKGQRMRLTLLTPTAKGNKACKNGNTGYVSTDYASGPVEHFCFKFVAGKIHLIDGAGKLYVFPGDGHVVVNTLYMKKQNGGR